MHIYIYIYICICVHICICICMYLFVYTYNTYIYITSTAYSLHHNPTNPSDQNQNMNSKSVLLEAVPHSSNVPSAQSYLSSAGERVCACDSECFCVRVCERGYIRVCVCVSVSMSIAASSSHVGTGGGVFFWSVFVRTLLYLVPSLCVLVCVCFGGMYWCVRVFCVT